MGVGSGIMARTRNRPSSFLAHRRVRRSRPEVVKHRLGALELDIVKHTLASLAAAGLISPDDLDGLLNRMSAAVSARIVATKPARDQPLLPAPVEARSAQPQRGNRIPDPDPFREAGALIRKWGSARAALEAATADRGRGRKPAWLKILAESADMEERREASRRTSSEYKFASIPRKPAVPIGQSVKDDYIVCLVDGSKRTFLTRYLLAKFGMTPQDYRIHFGLPSDYPMTASNYRALKSRQAHDQGLGLPSSWKARK